MLSSPRLRLLILLNLSAILGSTDYAILPSLYDHLLASSEATHSGIWMIDLIRASTLSFFSLLAAYLSLKHGRIQTVALGSALWGSSMLFLGLAPSYWSVAVSRMANGFSLAILLPPVQSLVADCHADHRRGLGFGCLRASSQMGAIFSFLFATFLAGKLMFLSLPAWRLASIVIGILGLLVGFWVHLFGLDPRPSKRYHARHSFDGDGDSYSDLTHELWQEASQVAKVLTFKIIVLQGIVNQVPMSAIALFSPWLQLVGFSPSIAAILVSLFLLGVMFGSIFGGWIGDVACRRNPTVGRILCAQFSAGIAIPLSAILLVGVPGLVHQLAAFGCTLFLMGFLVSWNYPACNWPILSEVVPSRLRTTLFSLDFALEKPFSVFGVPLIRALSRSFYGYHSLADSQPISIEEKLEDASALAKGLLLSMTVPYFACVICIFGLYWTYPSDRSFARVESWVEHSKEAMELLEDGGYDGSSVSSSRQSDFDGQDQEEILMFRSDESHSPPITIVELELRAARSQAEIATGVIASDVEKVMDDNREEEECNKGEESLLLPSE